MKVPFALLTLSTLLTFLAACQAAPGTALDSPSPAASPALNPSAPATSPAPVATPVPVASALRNPRIIPACDRAFLLCPDGEACAQPSCAPPAALPEPRTTETIEIGQHQTVATRFGLSEVSRAEDALSGLQPALPLIRAFKSPCLAGDGLYRTNGRRSACVVYVAETSPGGYELLDTVAKVKARYAPVTSPEEAQALAAMLTGDSPRSSLTPLEPGWRYFVRQLEPSRVSAEGSGYKLSLFRYQLFGCGPHPHHEISYTVSAQGDVTETGRIKLYEDPAEDGLCVD